MFNGEFRFLCRMTEETERLCIEAVFGIVGRNWNEFNRVSSVAELSSLQLIPSWLCRKCSQWSWATTRLAWRPSRWSTSYRSSRRGDLHPTATVQTRIWPCIGTICHHAIILAWLLCPPLFTTRRMTCCVIHMTWSPCVMIWATWPASTWCPWRTSITWTSCGLWMCENCFTIGCCRCWASCRRPRIIVIRARARSRSSCGTPGHGDDLLPYMEDLLLSNSCFVLLLLFIIYLFIYLPLCCSSSSFKYGIDICMKLAWCFLNMHKLCGLRPETEVKCCFCCCQTMTWPSDFSRFASAAAAAAAHAFLSRFAWAEFSIFLCTCHFLNSNSSSCFPLLLLLSLWLLCIFWLTSSSCLCFQATMSWHLHFSLPGQAAKN